MHVNPPSPARDKQNERLGRLAVLAGFISDEEQAEALEACAEEPDVSLAAFLLQRGWISLANKAALERWCGLRQTCPADLQEVLLEEIREQPEDDGPRLALADWLMDQADPAQAARGQFIALQCRAARLAEDDAERADLTRQAEHLLRRHETAWLGTTRRFLGDWEFRRGMLHVVAATIYYRGAWLVDLIGTDAWPWIDSLKAPPVDVPDRPGPGWYVLGSLCDWAGARNLTALDLSGLSLGHEPGAHGVRQLAASSWLDRLSALDVSENDLTDRGLGFLAGARCLGHLRTLDLRANDLGPDGARALASSAYLTRLTRLGLAENRLRAEGVDELVCSSNASDLLELDLRSNGLGDAGAWVLAGAPRLAKLQVLRLAVNDVTSDGAKALAQSPHLGRLAVLDLSGNRVGDAGALALAATASLGKLRRLDVSGNAITEPRRQALRARFGDRVRL
jgi:uncharacterized protein (TIGR02996 family)